MALFLEDKWKATALELHRVIHPRSTTPDEITLDFAFTLMKQAVTKLAAQKREEVRRDSERNTDLLNMKLLDSQRDKMDEILLAHAPPTGDEPVPCIKNRVGYDPGVTGIECQCARCKPTGEESEDG